MSNNPSRTVSRDDRWSHEAKQSDEYWLCECGVARENAEPILSHLVSEGHMAEKVKTDDGVVIAFMAAGMSSHKYGEDMPDSAQLPRESYKNDPIFERP